MLTRAARTRSLASAAGACLLACAAASGEPVRRVLVDRTLAAREVAVVAIETDAIEILHADGVGEPVPMRDVAALLPVGEARPDAGAWLGEPRGEGLPVVVRLVDGQVALGVLAGAGVDGPAGGAPDTALVLIPGAGTVAIPLDRVRRLDLAPLDDAPEVETTGDTVLLRNGDAVGGYVLGVQPTLEIEGDLGVVELALEDVARVTLANPGETAGVTLVTLVDGSVLGVSSIATSGQSVRLTLALGSGEGPAGSESAGSPAVMATALSRVSALTPAGSGARALASLGEPAYEPTGRRRWTAPPETIATGAHAFDAVRFPGPLRATWSLPAGATRFAARATLGPVAGDWADCELIVQAATPGGEVTLERRRLWRDDPHADVLVTIPAGATALSIGVLPGAHGPVHDRVTLERPMILVP